MDEARYSVWNGLTQARNGDVGYFVEDESFSSLVNPTRSL